MKSELPDGIKKVRRDLSDYVWHFTNRDGNSLETLTKIFDSRRVLGNTDRFCPDRCGCFTESPLLETIRQSPVLDEYNYRRMSDYGIGFKKPWIFEKGGRPVIYSTRDDAKEFPESMRWRHCELDYQEGLDFTWQREWRILGDLGFCVDDDVVFVVPTFDEGMSFLCSDGGVDHVHDEVFVTIDFPFVTIDSLLKSTMSEPLELDAYTNCG